MKRIDTTKRELKLLKELVAFGHSPIDKMSIIHFLGKKWGGHIGYLLERLGKKGWVKLDKISRWTITRVHLTHNYEFSMSNTPKKYTCLDEILFEQRATSGWDGSSKDITKECEYCPAYKVSDKTDRRCYAGKAWKELAVVANPRKCTLYETLEEKLPSVD